MTRIGIIDRLGWEEVRAEPGWVNLTDDFGRQIAHYSLDATIDRVQQILYDNMDVLDGDYGEPMPDSVMRAHTMLEEYQSELRKGAAR